MSVDQAPKPCLLALKHSLGLQMLVLINYVCYNSLNMCKSILYTTHGDQVEENATDPLESWLGYVVYN